MLRLNLILNNLVSSLPNVIQGDSLIDWGHERKDGTFDKMFDYVVSNPPFKEDFSQTVTNAAFKNTDRFFAGIPNVPKGKTPTDSLRASQTCQRVTSKRWRYILSSFSIFSIF